MGQKTENLNFMFIFSEIAKLVQISHVRSLLGPPKTRDGAEEVPRESKQVEDNLEDDNKRKFDTMVVVPASMGP